MPDTITDNELGTTITVSRRTFDASKAGLLIAQRAGRDECTVEVIVSDPSWRHSTIATVMFPRPIGPYPSSGVIVTLYDFAFTFRTNGSGSGTDQYHVGCTDSPSERPRTSVEARADASCAAKVASARIRELLERGDAFDRWAELRARDFIAYVDHARRVD